MNVAIHANTAKNGIRTLIPAFIEGLERVGIGVVLNDNLRDILGPSRTYQPEGAFFEGADLVVSFGGDGTILRVAGLTVGTGLPILGVNLGKVGFLAEVSPQELDGLPERLLARDYEILDRMAFSARTNGGEGYFALNDIVLDRSTDTRILNLSIAIDGQHAGGFAADGLIVATPTGSTAHSVSAGGPLVMPECSVIILTPICPHSLTIRPMVIDSAKTVRIEVVDGTARMAVDGQSFIEMPPESGVTISRAHQPVRIARLVDKTYFDILHKRLNWGVTPTMRNA